MLGQQALRDIICTTIRNHPKDCVFVPDAVDRAVIMVLEACSNASAMTDPIDLIADAIEAQEIYCPHEGIDKREDYQCYWGA